MRSIGNEQEVRESSMTTTVSPSSDSLPERRREFLVYYEFCYPVEGLFYKTLRARYPEMSVMDIVVCRAAYIADTTGGLGLYERRYVWSFDTIPQEEWPRYLLETTYVGLPIKRRCPTLEEAKNMIQSWINESGLDEVLSLPIFPNEASLEHAVSLAQVGGYLTAPVVQVNQEIQKLLDDALAQAVQTEDYVSDGEVFAHEQQMAEYDRRNTA